MTPRACSQKFNLAKKLTELFGYSFETSGSKGTCYLQYRPANATCALNNPVGWITCQDRRLKESKVCARVDEDVLSGGMTKCEEEVLMVRKDMDLNECSSMCRKKGYKKCWAYTYSAMTTKCILQKRAPTSNCAISKKSGADDYRTCRGV